MGYQETYDRILQKREETAVEKRKRIRNEQLIEKKKEELDALCSEMYAKKQDVDELKKNSLGNLLRKIAGSYDQSYEKEYREYVEAKLKYDEMTAAVEALQKETERLGSSIRQAEREIDRLYEELSGEPQAAEVLAGLEEKKTERYQRLKELIADETGNLVSGETEDREIFNAPIDYWKRKEIQRRVLQFIWQ